MIIPNLAVSDMRRSLAFYAEVVGLSVKMTVAADRSFAMAPDSVDDPVFAILELDGAEFMLQQRDSLAGDLPGIEIGAPNNAGTIYIRGVSADDALARAPAGAVIKGPELSWYGMKEGYLRDPDGHILCLGAPEGDGPAG